MNNILIISELCDYKASIKRHYSLTKGFYLAQGFQKHANTYYLTTGKSEPHPKINLININEITEKFLDTVRFILFIREGNILDILDKIPKIKDLMFNKKRKQVIGIKGDTISWLYSKIYRKTFPNKYKMIFMEFCSFAYDIICCQTEEYKDLGLELVKKKHPKYYDKIKSKIFISRMGVPNKYPLDFTLKNPYDINHKYCCDYYPRLKNNMALHPLCYTDKGAAYNPNGTKNYHTDKIKLIYMGRMKIEKGKMIYLLKNIMKKLGEDYELHLFPGRFILPDCDVSVFSPKFAVNLQMLRDSMFYDCKNVIVHYPFDDTTKQQFLQFVDIGIDLSQNRPKDEKSPQGNAKLLEYCYYGLKVVTEKNVNNSHLVTSGKNGILLDGIASGDDYVEAIKKVAKMKYNKQETIKITIKNNSWDLIASEFIDKINKFNP